MWWESEEEGVQSYNYTQQRGRYAEKTAATTGGGGGEDMDRDRDSRTRMRSGGGGTGRFSTGLEKKKKKKLRLFWLHSLSHSGTINELLMEV